MGCVVRKMTGIEIRRVYIEHSMKTSIIVSVLLLTNTISLSAVTSEPMQALHDTFTFEDTCAITALFSSINNRFKG